MSELLMLTSSESYKFDAMMAKNGEVSMMTAVYDGVGDMRRR